jgi:pyrimidine operon attenuation protein/uracil phosphoribosyltransferase
MSNRIFMQHQAILDLIQGMARLTQHHLQDRNIRHPVMIGIHTGGVWIAERLHQLMQIEAPLGQLDISFYRDDFTRIGMNPQVKPSQISFDVEDQHIVLVDDVVQSGRTIRAAMNEIFDFGRPASITLVTLIERSGRELPIQPDIIGLEPPLSNNEHIRLQGPEPLGLEISGKPGNREPT